MNRYSRNLRYYLLMLSLLVGSRSAFTQTFGRWPLDEKPNLVFSIALATQVNEFTRKSRPLQSFSASIYYRDDVVTGLIGGAALGSQKVGLQYWHLIGTDYSEVFMMGAEFNYLDLNESPDLSGKLNLWSVSMGPNIGFQKSIYKGLYIRPQLGGAVFLTALTLDFEDGGGFFVVSVQPMFTLEVGWMINP